MPPRRAKKNQIQNPDYFIISKIFKYYDSKLLGITGTPPLFKIKLSELYFIGGNEKLGISQEFMYNFLYEHLGLSVNRISNIVSHILKIKNLDHCSFPAIINDPFAFTMGTHKVLTFNQAQKICTILNIPVGINNKCISWIEHYLTNEKGSIWKPRQYLIDALSDIIKRGFNPRSSPDTNLPDDFNMDTFSQIYLKNKKINPTRPNNWYATSRELYRIECKINEMMCSLFFTKQDGKLQIIPSQYNYISDIELDELIANFQSEYNSKKKQTTKLNQAQIDAIKGAIRHKLSVIIGQPGTGKSTIAECITYCLYKIGCKHISLTAISGMAVGSIKSKCTEVATKDSDLIGTLDKLLYTIYPDKSKSEMPNVIIIDEFSMVDIFKWYQILEHLTYNSAQVILIGDHYQLPSIGPGQLLKTITDNESGIYPVYKLTDIMRQTGALSQIIKDMTVRNLKESDFNYIDFLFEKFDGKSTDVFIQNIIIKYDLKPDTSRFLCSQTKGVCGIDNMNKILQNIHNPTGLHINGGGMVLPSSENNFDGQATQKYRIGDLIMRTSNNYLKDEKTVYLNGDVGKIQSINNNPTRFNVIYQTNFNEIIKSEEIDIKELNEVFTLSYAISVHKSQGSQYDTVVIMMTPDQQFMWCDEKCDGFNLLYTAISRAQTRCIIIGDMEIFKKAQQKWANKINNRLSICARVEYMK